MADNNEINNEREELEPETPAEELPEPQPTEKVIYRWEYSEALKKAPEAPKGKHGAVVFAIVMTAAFLLSFAALAISLMIKPNVVYYDSGSEAAADMIEDVLDSVVIVSATKSTSASTGSGIVISKDGYIITNAHVVNGADNVTVKFHNGKITKVLVVGMSEWDDIAVLKAPGLDLHPATLADSSAVRAGESVYAIGAPAGADYGWTTTGGIISSATRYMKVYSTAGVMTKRIKVIQTDAPVNSGNSGGPLIDAGGNVIGVISMKLSDEYENMGFALPINEVMVIVDQLIEKGSADRASSPLVTPRLLIGITGVGVEGGKYYVMNDSTRVEIPKSDVGNYPAKDIMAPDVSGVYVNGVTDGYDAANYLREGDVIVAVNDIEVLTIYDVMDVINELSDSDTVSIRYYRDGKLRENKIKLKFDISS